MLFTGALGAALVLAFTWYLNRRESQIQTNLRFSDPTVCAQILACVGYDNTGAKNEYSNLKSRAIPNERLVRAFGIDNSFTTSEIERHKEFKIEAGKTIEMKEGEVGTPWQETLSSFHRPQHALQEHRVPILDILFPADILET